MDALFNFRRGLLMRMTNNTVTRTFNLDHRPSRRIGRQLFHHRIIDGRRPATGRVVNFQLGATRFYRLNRTAHQCSPRPIRPFTCLINVTLRHLVTFQRRIVRRMVLEPFRRGIVLLMLRVRHRGTNVGYTRPFGG